MHGCHGLNHIDTWAFHTLSIRRELYLVVVPHRALVLLNLPLFLLEDQRWQLEEVDLRTDRLGIVCCTFFECNGGCAQERLYPPLVLARTADVIASTVVKATLQL